jgi:hypothetical protein
MRDMRRKRIFEIAQKLRNTNYEALVSIAGKFEEVAEESDGAVVEELDEVLR